MTGALRDRRALITGGASGIGRAITEAFLAEGARVVVLDRDGTVAEKAARDAGAAGSVAADVADEAQVEQAVVETEKLLGGIDVLVNAAGILTQAPLVEMSPASS